MSNSISAREEKFSDWMNQTIPNIIDDEEYSIYERPGRFSLAVKHRFDKVKGNGTVRPALIKAILGQCVIVKAEWDYCAATIEYTAYCDKFEKLEDGLIPPVYVWHGIDSDDGIVVYPKKV